MAGKRQVSAALLRSLVPPLWRTLPWRRLTTAAALGLLLAASTRLPSAAPDHELGLLVLRLTALAGALGLAFLLDDPARNTSATTPIGRPVRTALRLALAAPLAAVWWTAALLLVPSPTRPPLAPVTLQAAAMAVGAVALATVAIRFTDTAEVGRNTAIALGTATATAILVPNRWGLLATPADPWWQETQLRWAAVLMVTVGVLALWTPERLPRRSGHPSPSDV
ncbi:ABC transporter [Streptomyces sp. NPDC049687]|uniref:ABC transporter n=1 Tax=Streptomyces sp. NPDC049687 TaxID=3365596 RepID=UPI0037B03C64